MFKQSVCAACGERSELTVIGDYKTIGSPDLDGRPAPMYRNMMKYWLEECPHCGYIAEDISKTQEYSIPLMMSGYNLARHWHIPSLAKRFAKYALGLRTINRDDIAWKQFLAGVWVCEDEHDESATDMMLRCTLDAIELALMAIGDDKKARSELNCVRADVLRRLGEFAELAEMSLINLTDEGYKLLVYEKHLAELGDSSVHNSSELWQSLEDVDFLNSAFIFAETGAGIFTDEMLTRLYHLAVEGGSNAAKQCLFELFDRGLFRELMASLSTFERLNKK